MKLTTAELNKMNLEEVSPGVYRSRNAGITPRFTKEKDIVSRVVEQTEDFQYSIKTEWFIPNYQVPSKKNSRQNFVKNGRQISIPSKRHEDYITATKKYWEVFGLEFRAAVKALGLEYPLNIEFTFIRKTNQIVDYFGPGETVADLLRDFGWIPDDSSRYLKPSFGDMRVDKDKYGVIVRLLTNAK